MKTVDTPGQHSIDEISSFFNISAKQCLKTLIVKSEDDGLIALVLRGDHELNTIKAEKLAGVLSPLTFADNAELNLALAVKLDRLALWGYQYLFILIIVPET